MAKKNDVGPGEGHFGLWKSPGEDGREMLADTIADANYLRFNGWTLQEKPTDPNGIEYLVLADEPPTPAE